MEKQKNIKAYKVEIRSVDGIKLHSSGNVLFNHKEESIIKIYSEDKKRMSLANYSIHLRELILGKHSGEDVVEEISLEEFYKKLIKV